MMQCLPPLTSGECVWRLPLSETTASYLLLASTYDEGERESTVRLALQGDAKLALWACCRADQAGAASQQLADVAAWLSLHLLDELRWECVDESAPTTSTTAGLQERAVAVAETCEQLSPGSYLLGLLSGAEQLLAESGPTISLPDEPGCLPAWLAEALGELSTGQASTPESQCVSAVLAEGGGDAAPRTPAPTIAQVLPTIIELLADGASLRTDFDSRLEQEKLESLKQLAYGASHEINNPLANISTRAQTLLRDETDPERRRRLATINAQAFRAHEMISDMMLFAHPPDMDQAVVDLRIAIERVVDELAEAAAEQGTSVVVSEGDTLLVDGDEHHLAIALKSLVRNSLEAIESGGRIRIDLAEEAGEARLVVSDSGPGITAEVRRHLFDPFYSGREAGRGLGLGLSKCWRVVTLHGGSILVGESQLGGAEFTIALPTTTSAATDQSSAIAAAAGA